MKPPPLPSIPHYSFNFPIPPDSCGLTKRDLFTAAALASGAAPRDAARLADEALDELQKPKGGQR